MNPSPKARLRSTKGQGVERQGAWCRHRQAHRQGQRHLQGRCTIETVDVVKDFAAAVQDNILITPTLVLVAPLPRVTILGNLSDHPKVLLALRLSEDAS